MEMEWNGTTVLVVDANFERRVVVTSILEKEGATVFSTESADAGAALIMEYRPGLIILDASFSAEPDAACCQQMRQLTDSPIVILATVNQTRLVIRAMDAGADDYLIAPVEPDVLLLRVWAALHRARQANGPGTTFFDDGYLQVDLIAHQVLINGEYIKVTATEFALLAYLIRRGGQVCTFEELLMNVWGSEFSNRSQYIHVFVWHLRQKIEPDPKHPTYLISEHSIGYRFRGDQTTQDGAS